jgi:diguanylate cyclase (GGDEF)-like protein
MTTALIDKEGKPKTWPQTGRSVFPRAIDRAAVCSFFLGGLVPLIMLGSLIENSALTVIGTSVKAADPLYRAALFSSVAFLSLFSFLYLRRLFTRAIDENRVLALYDGLTDLPNRRQCLDQLEKKTVRARENGHLIAICFLDLDGFKRVNDNLGHEIGDALLCQVSKRLTSELRMGDSVVRLDKQKVQSSLARFGGDEFVITLYDVASTEDASCVAERLLTVFVEPFVINDHSVFVTASIGITMFPFDGDETAILIRNADAAMYEAKQLGRNNHQFYEKALDEKAKRRFQLEERLRLAVKTDGLQLAYQPLCDGATGELIGAEALLRWSDPLLGNVSPVEFIPIAEDSGLILPIGEWVLREACGQVRAWELDGGRPIRIAVNVSGIQVRKPGLVDLVRDVLEETGLDPSNLELEITESIIMDDSLSIVSTFEALNALGVGLVLDDFGTGYSSLSYLRRFPIGKVKIDRTFVALIPDNLGDSTLIAAIISMAHSMNLIVTAEGVENVAQANFLRELACDELQGYFFGKPAVDGALIKELSRMTPEDGAFKETPDPVMATSE